MKTDLGKGKMRSITSLLKTKVNVKGRPCSLPRISSVAHGGEGSSLLLGGGVANSASTSQSSPRKAQGMDAVGQSVTPTGSWFTEGQGWGTSEAGPTGHHFFFEQPKHPSPLSCVPQTDGPHPCSWMGNSTIFSSKEEEEEALLSLRPCSDSRFK